jgi:hypothetical protein
MSDFRLVPSAGNHVCANGTVLFRSTVYYSVCTGSTNTVVSGLDFRCSLGKAREKSKIRIRIKIKIKIMYLTHTAFKSAYVLDSYSFQDGLCMYLTHTIQLMYKVHVYLICNFEIKFGFNLWPR